jgi:hypothetical protein
MVGRAMGQGHVYDKKRDTENRWQGSEDAEHLWNATDGLVIDCDPSPLYIVFTPFK